VDLAAYTLYKSSLRESEELLHLVSGVREITDFLVPFWPERVVRDSKFVFTAAIVGGVKGKQM
jgi:hypothetical protein